MVAMVWANYNSQVEIRDASLKQFHANAHREASSIAHFFSERRNNLEDLSNSRELPAYYENKALGMSKEYGLWASLVGISALFERFVEDKKLDEIPIFDRILYVDTSDGILADNKGAAEGQPAENHPFLSQGECSADRPCLFFRVEQGEIDLVMAQALFFPKKAGGEHHSSDQQRRFVGVLRPACGA